MCDKSSNYKKETVILNMPRIFKFGTNIQTLNISL